MEITYLVLVEMMGDGFVAELLVMTRHFYMKMSALQSTDGSLPLLIKTAISPLLKSSAPAFWLPGSPGNLCSKGYVPEYIMQLFL